VQGGAEITGQISGDLVITQLIFPSETIFRNLIEFPMTNLLQNSICAAP